MHLFKEKMKKIIMLIATIFVCSITLIVILFGLNQFKTGSQLTGIKQISNLSHLLIRQQANLFSILLMNNAKLEQLSEALESFVKEEFVIDASIYSTNGELLTQSKNSIAINEHLNLLKKDDYIYNQQIVEPIYSKNGIEGFLRVTFNNKYNKQTQNILEYISLRLYAEFIIVFFIGIILSSSISYFLKSYKRHSNNLKIEIINKNNKEKTRLRSIEFHRRRRRFFR